MPHKIYVQNNKVYKNLYKMKAEIYQEEMDIQKWIYEWMDDNWNLPVINL